MSIVHYEFTTMLVFPDNSDELSGVKLEIGRSIDGVIGKEINISQYDLFVYYARHVISIEQLDLALAKFFHELTRMQIHFFPHVAQGQPITILRNKQPVISFKRP